MRIELRRPCELRAAEVDAWRELVTTAGASPYLHPAWSQAADAVLDDVRVALLREGSEVVGAFPFAAGPDGRATAPAALISDGDGIVLAPGAAVDDARGLLRGCGLSRYTFVHTPAEQDVWQSSVHEVSPSAHLDLTGGFAAYRARREASGTQLLKQADRKRRKLGRELGEVRFALDVPVEQVAPQLLRWKAAALPADPFAGADWVVPLLRAAHARREPGWASVLSGLWVGDRLVAAHWGLRGDAAYVSGIPAHDPEAARWSPGLVLTLDLARALAADGVTDLELGLGLNALKRSLMTHTEPLAAGVVDVSLPWVHRLHRKVRRLPVRWGVRAEALLPPLAAASYGI